MVGYPNQRLYATRDAVANFHNEVRKFMAKKGFTAGRYKLWTLFDREREPKILVHGYDFAASGHREQCACTKQQFE